MKMQDGTIAMWGNDTVETRYIVLMVVLLIGLYIQLCIGWGERIEWLQSLSQSESQFLE